MEQTGVDEVTNMEKDASKLWFTSLTAGAVVGIDKIVMLIALIVFRIGWWATIYCQQILLGMLTIFGPIQWAFSLLPGNVRQLKNITEQISIIETNRDITAEILRNYLPEQRVNSGLPALFGVKASAGKAFESEREIL